MRRTLHTSKLAVRHDVRLEVPSYRFEVYIMSVWNS